MLVTDCAGVQPLVVLSHVLQSQQTVLVTETGEGSVVRDALGVVAPLHGGLGVGGGDLAAEPDRAGHDDSLVRQVSEDLWDLQNNNIIVSTHNTRV